jgi:hypothetical protein
MGSPSVTHTQAGKPQDRTFRKLSGNLTSALAKPIRQDTPLPTLRDILYLIKPSYLATWVKQ